MFASQKRLSRAFNNAKVLPFDDTSRIILFSDVHRGDNGFADDFADNGNTYYHALKYYFQQGFTYIELGDGDELWEQLHFESIFEAHKNVFLLMRKFYQEDRLHLLWGNHDMVYRNPDYAKKHLYSYFEPRVGKKVRLFPEVEHYEAIVLEHTDTGQRIFLTHGHQADFMNYVGWRINRFLVRVLWKPLQILGVFDPTSPAKNYKELIRQERRVKRWIAANNNQMTIIGHTHRPRFPEPGEMPFFNDGCCVHPRTITGIEIEHGQIALIKWHIATRDDGTLQIVRVLLDGPEDISDYANDKYLNL